MGEWGCEPNIFIYVMEYMVGTWGNHSGVGDQLWAGRGKRNIRHSGVGDQLAGMALLKLTTVSCIVHLYLPRIALLIIATAAKNVIFTALENGNWRRK